jgi:hypothetical protein
MDCQTVKGLCGDRDHAAGKDYPGSLLDYAAEILFIDLEQSRRHSKKPKTKKKKRISPRKHEILKTR